MFTGIVEEIGTVRSVRAGASGAVLDISASKVIYGTKLGDSISVNGVCLTVTPGAGHFTADVMPESLRRTSLGSLTAGSKVNLERAMECGGTKEGIAVLMTVSVPVNLLKYIAEKGSVTLDGTSLTVVSAGNDSFVVSLIPHTLSSTTLGLLRVGSPVNVEVDMLARYVERLLDFGKNEPDGSYKESDSGRLTIDFLKDNGF